MENSKKTLNYIQAELVKEKREKINRLVQSVQIAQGEYALVRNAIAEVFGVPEKEQPDWQFSNDGKSLEKPSKPEDPKDKKVIETVPKGEKKSDKDMASKP